MDRTEVRLRYHISNPQNPDEHLIPNPRAYILPETRPVKTGLPKWPAGYSDEPSRRIHFSSVSISRIFSISQCSLHQGWIQSSPFTSNITSEVWYIVQPVHPLCIHSSGGQEEARNTAKKGSRGREKDFPPFRAIHIVVIVSIKGLSFHSYPPPLCLSIL